LHALQWVDLFGKQWQENAEVLVRGCRAYPPSRARRWATAPPGRLTGFRHSGRWGWAGRSAWLHAAAVRPAVVRHYSG
jgi:hypothetical protein